MDPFQCVTNIERIISVSQTQLVSFFLPQTHHHDLVVTKESWSVGIFLLGALVMSHCNKIGP